MSRPETPVVVTTPEADRVIVNERLLRAPRELVFAAWTEPEQVAKWWGPDGFTNTIHEMDVRPGGTWRFVMHGPAGFWRQAKPGASPMGSPSRQLLRRQTPNGVDYPNHIVFVEVVRPERIVYDHLSTPRFRSTVTFVDEGGHTRLTMRAVFVDAQAYAMAVDVFGAVEGGRQHLGRLAAFVEPATDAGRPALDPGPLLEATCSERDGTWTVALVRDLAYPRERVWEVLTDPRHLREWAPFTTDRTLATVGAAVVKMIDGEQVEESASEVRVADAPAVLEYTWGDDLLRWELEATAGGTRLTLRHTLGDRDFAPKVSAGWQLCLAVADRLLAGRPFGPVVGRAAREHGWEELNDAYARRFGVPNTGWPLG